MASTGTGKEVPILSGIGNALAGLQGGGKDKGLAGAAPEEVRPQMHHRPEDDAPSKETQAKYGDVDKAVPAAPLDAAKQHMERERGGAFTSASGKPTFES